MSNPYQAPKSTAEAPDYQRNPLRSYAEIALAITAILFLLAVTLFVVFSRTRFGRMLEDFEMRLPIITRCTLSLAYPVLLGVVLLLTLVKEFVPSWRRFGIGWNITMFPLAVLLLVVYLAGVLVPLGMLAEGLSK